jgi:hypothetical protein
MIILKEHNIVKSIQKTLYTCARRNFRTFDRQPRPCASVWPPAEAHSGCTPRQPDPHPLHHWQQGRKGRSRTFPVITETASWDYSTSNTFSIDSTCGPNVFSCFSLIKTVQLRLYDYISFTTLFTTFIYMYLVCAMLQTPHSAAINRLLFYNCNLWAVLYMQMR